MIANHIHDALAQVRKLQEVILEKKMFRGYSGTARILGGLSALAGAIVLARLVPRTPTAQLRGWGMVLGLGLLFNYGGLAFWLLSDPEARRDKTLVKPAMDAVPALAVGAFLSLAILLRGYHDLLFGTWMCCFGLSHIPYRQSLPMSNYLVGIFYILCGAVCLLHPSVSFTNPWPMGLVFLAGECTGGSIFYRHRRNDGT